MSTRNKGYPGAVFKQVFFDPDETQGDGYFICKVNSSCKPIYQNKIKGYTNLIAHVKTHDNWESEIKKAMKMEENQAGSMTQFIKRKVSNKGQNLYDWIQWVVMDVQEFSFVDNKYTRKNTKLEPICRTTLMKYIENLSIIVEEKIKQIIPNTFGIIFDGWTCDGTAEHYIALFAVWCDCDGNVNRVLLCCGPQDEIDEDNPNEVDFTAENIGDYIYDELQLVGRDFSSIEFLAGDNCSVNKKLATKLKVPLLGCNSHRLNLAMKASYSENEGLINKINDLMIELRTLKNASKLRKKTNICPERKNVTRWHSTHNMISKYIKLHPTLPQCGFNDNTVEKLLTQSEYRKVERMLQDSDKFIQVSKLLQKDDGMNLHIVRELFDGKNYYYYYYYF